MPFCPFFGEGSPTKIDYRKKGTIILTSLLTRRSKPKQRRAQAAQRQPASMDLGPSDSQGLGPQPARCLLEGVAEASIESRSQDSLGGTKKNYYR